MADTHFLRPLSAREALDKVIEISAAVFKGRQLQLKLTTNIASVSLVLNPVAQSELLGRIELAKFREQLERSIAPLACTSFAVVDVHHSNNPKPSIHYSVPDVATAQLLLDNFADPDWAITASNVVGTSFDLVPRSDILSSHLPAQQQDAIKFQAAATAQLHTEVAKIAAFNIDQLKKQDDFFSKLATEQDERYLRRAEELTVQHRQLEEELRDRARSLDEEHRTRLLAVEAMEREHQRRVHDHDTRESTAVRRELRTTIEELLDNGKEVELSFATARKRLLVHILCASALILSATLIAYFASVVATETEAHWHHVTPLSAGVVLFASTLIYYVKWIDRWFREHARTEFQNRKLRSDIVRASWLAELTFEGREKGRELPQVLVERFSDGLFLDHSDAPVEHPTDAVLTFLQRVSSIKVGQGSVEVTKTASKESA